MSTYEPAGSLMWTGGGTDRRTDGQTDGRAGRRADGQTDEPEG